MLHSIPTTIAMEESMEECVTTALAVLNDRINMDVAQHERDDLAFDAVLGRRVAGREADS